MLLEEGKIQSAIIIDNEFHGHLVAEELTPPGRRQQHTFRDFVVDLGVVDAQTREEWLKYGVDFRFQKPSNWLNIFLIFAVAPVHRALAFHFASDARRSQRCV